MQTCLEKKGIEERHIQTNFNYYQSPADLEYKETHPDALSTGDPLGKGSGNGGHGHSVPNCSLDPNMISYANFDTYSENIGGLYDIEGREAAGVRGGRNYLKGISVYNETYQYGAPCL